MENLTKRNVFVVKRQIFPQEMMIMTRINPSQKMVCFRFFTFFCYIHLFEIPIIITLYYAYLLS